MQFNRCMKCMNEIEGYPCPHCGYTSSSPVQNDQAMRPGSILNGRYVVGCLLGQGGFGMTYVGFDLILERRIAIKEYFPSGQAMRSDSTGTILHWSGTATAMEMRRNGTDNVMKEARKMAAVSDIPEIVGVRDAFQANDTAYLVMDYVEGVTLKTYLEQKGSLTWQEAKTIFYPAITAMSQIHRKGLIHRDISPDNMMITPDGRTKILDLGAAKDLNRNSGASSMLVAKAGFSPVEQYIERGHSGPWTDVYAMAATIYYCLTKTKPQSAMERMMKDEMCFDLPDTPAPVASALRRAMTVRPEDRTKDMDAFLQDLETVGRIPVNPSVKPPVDCDKEGDNTRKKPSAVWIILAAVLLALAAAGIGLWFEWHPWKDADCTDAKTCRLCGKEEGEPLGHDWLSADCSHPETCSRCGLTRGKPVEHSWRDADCTHGQICGLCGAEGGPALGHDWLSSGCTEPQTCSRCGETGSPALGHDWLSATCLAPKTCFRCGVSEGGTAAHQWDENTGRCTVCGIQDSAVITAGVGDTISFGSFEQDNNRSNGTEDIEWIVLDVRDGKALLLSRYALDTRAFHSAEGAVTWETCSLRTWLNGEFLNSAFTASEQASLQLTRVAADRNSQYSSDSGNDTSDRVFLLSLPEAEKYLTTQSLRLAYPTDYARSRNSPFIGSSNYAGSVEGAVCWWLRSPGRDDDCAADVSTGGSISYSGNNAQNGSAAGMYCVRPAIWVSAAAGQAEQPASSSGSFTRAGSGTVRAGSYISLGHYEQDNDLTNGTEPIEWLVLEVRDGKALVLSRYGLDTRPLNDAGGDSTWAACSLRSWLNGEFLNTAFSAEERRSILMSAVSNGADQCWSGWGTDGGSDSYDRIFLLSCAEASRYFGTDYWENKGAEENMSGRCSPTAYAIAQGAYVSAENRTSEGTAAGTWRLRSPGEDQSESAVVSSYGAFGVYETDRKSGMLRPAFWIDLSE